MARVGKEKRREMASLLVLPRPAESLQNGACFGNKTRTGTAEKERVASVPQCEQLASRPEPPLPKGKGTEQSVQIKLPDSEVGESQGERQKHLGERKGCQSGSVGRKGWTLQQKKATSQEESENTQRTALGEVEGSISG